MKFIDWFAGIGGFRRGMELCGHECVGFCEFDKYAVMSYTSMHLITEDQRAYLATLDLTARKKEILKEEYRNGEWYANDVRTVDARSLPDADYWCFGFPCQDISVAGKQLGFTGNRSSLFFRIMYILGQLEEEKKPTYLFIENVKNLLSVNGGWDFARLLVELDRGGYDAEWQVLNSKYFGVPQNRERCFIIGHLRGRSTAEVFPVEGTNGEDSVCRIVGHRDGYRRKMQVFDPDGVTETLDTGQGGGRGHHTILALNKDYKHRYEAVLDNAGISGTVMARDYKDPQRVAIPIGVIDDQGRNAKKVVPKQVAGTLRSETHGNVQKVVLPVLTPERANKRQNGRRFKENGEESFTLTAQDRHGVGIEITPIGGVYTNVSPAFKVEVKEATKQGYAVCRGGEIPSTSRCREVKQGEEESG